MQQRNDIYGLENDDKMQTSISWSTSRAVPMSCTALEMRCDAETDIQMQVGAAADDRMLRCNNASPKAPCCLAKWDDEATNHTRLQEKNGSHDINVSVSHDSPACILLEIAVGYKMDRRGLHGP